ncbi:hypothetical protein JCM6882_001447 [Rhodosporidiobolus microsporus]
MPSNLLDLPVELLEQIVRDVALLRYDYSESRRPKPSALHHLAYGTNRLLRSLALPYLARLASTEDAPTSLLLEKGKTVDSRQFASFLAHTNGTNETSDALGDDFNAFYPSVKRVVFSFPRREGFVLNAPAAWSPGLSQRPSTNGIQSLEIRHGARDPVMRVFALLSFFGHSYPTLETLTLFHCHHIARWSSLAEETASVTRLEVVLADSVREPLLAEWKIGSAWTRLEHFSLAVAPPSRDQDEPSMASCLEGFQLPPDSPLRSLSLSTQLPTRFTSPPHGMADVLPSIVSAFGSAALTSLAIDEYASCTAEDLATISTAFPTLKALNLGDRMVWKGTRAELLNALAPLTSLQLLSCRIPPDSPASSFRSSSDSGEEEYASPASIALEAASILPRLSRVGFSGRQSRVEWFVVSRTEEGKPERAEAVELYSLDLDRL